MSTDDKTFLVERLNLKEHRSKEWSYPGPLLINVKTFNNSDGENINGPSLIKVPEWVENPLGKYYLYFAHHGGKYIRMAYSDSITGPYTLYEGGTLKLNQTIGNDHIASPDVHIDDNNKEIIMYYHTPFEDWQYTFKSMSKDGLNFKSDNDKLGMFYFRVFEWQGRTFSIAKNRNTSGISYELIDGKWVPQDENFIPMMRHAAVLVEDDVVYVFYTIVGEAPESIYCSEVDIDNNWSLKNTQKLLEPLYHFEHANILPKPSNFGSGVGNELRDPCIYVEDEKKYLLYSVVGECGIAISELHDQKTKNLKKYNVWGLRRSGNHTIIEWIASHFKKTYHQNDIIQHKPWVTNFYGNGKQIDCLIDSFEDFEPSEINENTIILLRDWYNLSASRLNSGRGWETSCRQIDRHAYNRKCAEVYLKYCKLWEKYPDNFILYNKWVEDKNYAREIEKRYGWVNVSRHDKLPTSGIGNGSSFSDKTNSGFNDRYLNIIEKYPEDWKQICSNEEINEYSKKIFDIEIEW
jgi:hypothetical protein